MHWDIASWTWKQAKILDAGKEDFLRVISRVCQDAGIETPLLPVVAFYDNSVAVGVDKVFVKDMSPLLMKEFSLAMG